MANISINQYAQLSPAVMSLSIGGRYSILFDYDDYDKIRQHHWSISSNGYACSGAGKGQILFHRLVLNATPEENIDHINRNRLDNRKSNLRICSASQNSYNKAHQSNCQSGYRGVALDQYGRWVANINQNGKSIFLGSYSTPEKAANAYDSAAAIIAGEFAYRNLPHVPLRTNIFEELKGIRRKGRLTPEEYESILRREGHTYKMIAQRLDRSVDSAIRVIKTGQYNAWHRKPHAAKEKTVSEKKRHPNWLTTEQVSAISDFVKDGYKSTDIAWAVGCSISAINRLKKGETYQ